MKPKLGILISVLLSVFCSIAESKCSKGCDLALASYYVWKGSNLTFIAEVLQSDPDTIVSYNKQKIPNKHSVQQDIRINVPFPCNCINGEYLGHLFYYTVIQGDTYMKVAETYFANLTTYESLEANNSYAATNIPVGASLKVPVTCSCGGSSVSTEYGLFITYPLRPGDTLVSLAAETGLSTTLLQSYNPGVYFSQGSGLVYIPGKESKGNPLLKIVFGISGAVAGIVVISFVIIYSLKRRHFSSNAMVCCKSGANNFQTTNEEFVKKYGSIAPKRYTYSDVKKLTNSFKEKVGQGGYGVVYKGKLPDGRMVAVKILSASKGNGEEFINEVASISRTSHVNIVTLLGFCYEKTKRALIYEFMPNRSLDKFIYDKGHPITNHHLDSNSMFQIAVGIARGLEYLHRGCNTRILHFDIKPHNILLDEDLCPKISDFGLAKLCKTKESIVSMTGMRGTAGYIAPEVFSRYFGGVSHKSDVYSYGMLVLEMVGARKEFDNELSQTSETYFPHGIYNKLEQGESFVTLGDITEEEEDNTIKKMVMVSLWCTQISPSDRPSMSKVIEMLEGSLQSLQFPPKPVMHSHMRSPQDSSTSSQSQNPTF